MSNIISARCSEASAANPTPAFRRRGFKLQALQFGRKVGKLISPKTPITRTGRVVTAIIPDTITTQWQPCSRAAVFAAINCLY